MTKKSIGGRQLRNLQLKPKRSKKISNKAKFKEKMRVREISKGLMTSEVCASWLG